MDPITEAAIEEALELLKAGKKAQAQTILVPLARQNPNIPDVWYLLGFTVTDLDRKIYCFQQVLRIDPANEAAQKQLAKLLEHSQQPEAQPSENAKAIVTSGRDQKEAPKRNNKLTITLILTRIAMMVSLWGVVSYAQNGINTNQQANDLFTKHECAPLMQYSSFEELFPRELFSSVFSVYQQIEECQTQLALTDAVQLQDWAHAYSLTESYFVRYPHGAFIQEVSEYAGNILLSWSKKSLSQNDFETAIQKLEIIQSKFPTTSANSTASQTMLDDYLLWGRYSFAQKDYASAEKNLKNVAWNTKASLKQVKQANDDLVLVYLEWGKAQIASGQYAAGIASYENAKALNPTLMDYEQIETQAALTQTTALTQANDFDQALAIINALLTKTSANENRVDALAQQSKILNTYANSNSAQAQARMMAAASNLCKNKLPTLPIFGTNADVIQFIVDPAFSFPLPDALMAATPAELHAVVCIKQSSVSIESCEYQKGYRAQRNIYLWEVTLNDIKTGVPYQTSNFLGSEPRPCGETEAFNESKKLSSIYGDPPRIQEIIDWLTGLNIAR